MPNIPAGLPSSTVVLGHFSDFCARFPNMSVSPDNARWFGVYLRGKLPGHEARAILRRAEYPL